MSLASRSAQRRIDRRRLKNLERDYEALRQRIERLEAWASRAATLLRVDPPR